MASKFVTYLLIIGIFVSLTWLAIDKGEKMAVRESSLQIEESRNYTYSDKTRPVVIDSDENAIQQFISNVKSPLSLLLLQIIVILITSRIFGMLFLKLGQQTVIGEIVAGICLGPSLLGLVSPGVAAFLFPQGSFMSLQFLSQIGLAFFMFIIGMELDISKIKNKTHNAVIISHISIVLPFFLGVAYRCGFSTSWHHLTFNSALLRYLWE